MRFRRRSVRDDDDGLGGEIGENLAAVNDRLDALTRQIERIAQTQTNVGTRNDKRQDERPSARVSEALDHLDRRLEQVIVDGRRTMTGAPPEPERRSRVAPPPPSPPTAPQPLQGQNDWAAEISARRRLLDGEPPPASPPRLQTSAPAAPRAQTPAPTMATPRAQIPAPGPAKPPTQELTGLESQLRTITSQIESLHRPCDDAFAALRNDLAEVSRNLTDAMPRRAIEALETEVRTLPERIDRGRETGIDAASLASLEHGLAEVRDALHNFTPAGNQSSVDEALHILSRKIDQLSQVGPTSQNSPDLHQIEQAIDQLRSTISNVASEGALEQLAAEVHNLSSRFEHVATESNADVLSQLEHRIASLLDHSPTVPSGLETAIRNLSERLDHAQAGPGDQLPFDSLQTAMHNLSERLDHVQLSESDHFALDNLQAAIRGLSDRLEHLQLGQGDQLALGGLEDRIVKLAEKLDASDARLRNLDNIERGISDLLILLEEQRHAPPRGVKAAPEPPPPEPRPVAQALTAPNPPHAAMAPLAAEPLRDTNPPATMAQRPEPRRPINPDLPPDTPIEPGAGMPHVKPGSPAARIAASEAALRGAVPSSPNVGKESAIAAARNAARTAYSSAQQDEAKSESSWRKLLSRLSPKKSAIPVSEPAPKPVPKPAPAAAIASLHLERADAPTPIRKKIFGHVKTVLIAASVVIIVLGGLQAALDFFMPASSLQTPAAVNPDVAPAPAAPSTTPANPTPAPAAPTPPAAAPAPTAPGPTGSITPSLFDPIAALQPKVPAPDITGSIPQHPAAPVALTLAQAVAALPPSIGPVLRTAAAKGIPAAAYEISMRYADGRGVPRSGTDSLFWLERAAKAGFAPAQYRLGSFNEKGEGVKKDLANARRLYLAAANQGHAKAMHNLAVLYAEGIDGNPDYKLAAEWFRKAANRGVADSQYNLAILYARGIGVEQNLAESYRWLALAAAKGDRDAAKKRDELAKRLDPQSLVAAKLAVQTFTPDPEPAAAVSLRVPPGGWDQATVAVHPPKSKPHAPGPATR